MKKQELLKVAKPIKFTTEMAKAIKDGRKTQTRRKIKIHKSTGTFPKLEDGHVKDYNFHVCWHETKYYIKGFSKYQVNDILQVVEVDRRFNYKRNMFLKVTNIRVEQLQSIDFDDCLKEGVSTKGMCNCFGEIIQVSLPFCRFVDLWNSTIKKDEFELYSWGANPLVFVYEFELLRIKEND